MRPIDEDDLDETTLVGIRVSALAAPIQRRLQPCLVVLEGPSVGLLVRVQGQVTLGRSVESVLGALHDADALFSHVPPRPLVSVSLADGRQSLVRAALADLASRERYLAFEAEGSRYDIGARYGLLTAQLALGLSGKDRDEILGGLVDLLAHRAR